jgi:hypothetical protein
MFIEQQDIQFCGKKQIDLFGYAWMVSLIKSARQEQSSLFTYIKHCYHQYLGQITINTIYQLWHE